MGRVRRNQRDAIRKQRAKRRNKQTGGDDSDNDCVESTSVKRRRVVNDQVHVSSNNIDSGTDLGNKETKSPLAPVTDQSRSDSGAVQQSECTKVRKQPSEKAPVDRIERLRLKKQQQKARRKEKRAARASTSLKKVK
jgi:hypothetical protein